MNVAAERRVEGGRLTLPSLGIRASTFQLVLLGLAAWALPAAAHLAGLPVRQILPMHWPVILAGLVYGWRAGLLLGALAPCVSFMISGMPLPHILPAMTVELAAYGFLAGLAREVLRWNPFFAAALALVGGRAMFLMMALATGAARPDLSTYVRSAMAPGLLTALAQLILLPILAAIWVRLDTGPGSKGGTLR
ncbi:MAG: ECF transporter S component [Candidatus Eiseniibacteriota bacterium]